MNYQQLLHDIRNEIFNLSLLINMLQKNQIKHTLNLDNNCCLHNLDNLETFDLINKTVAKLTELAKLRISKT